MKVIDASSLAKYLLREEGWERVEEVLAEGVYSLPLVVAEVANAVWKHVTLRGAISVDEARKLILILLELIKNGVVILEEQERYAEKAFRIAVEHRITVYDAFYIAQASRHDGLVTSDAKQAEIAEKLGIPVQLIP